MIGLTLSVYRLLKIYIVAILIGQVLALALALDSFIIVKIGLRTAIYSLVWHQGPAGSENGWTN